MSASLVLLLSGITLKALVGPHVADHALWWGAVTASTFTVLLGCGYVLWWRTGRGVPQPVAPA